MTKKKIILGIIGMVALFFVLVMIFSSNEFVDSLKKQHTSYLNQKKIHTDGLILNIEKVSGKNKLIEIHPNQFSNTPILEKPYTTVGFRNQDTTKVFLIAPIPKSVGEPDSIDYTIHEAIFFKHHQEIARQKIQPMRWNIMQSEKLMLEKRLNEKLLYLY